MGSSPGKVSNIDYSSTLKRSKNPQIWGTDWISNKKKTSDIYTGKVDKKLAKKLRKFPWYVGGMHRAEAIALLMQDSQETGDFLVRDSNTWDNNFCLSVRAGSQTVRHYRIQYSPVQQRFFIVPETTFGSLENLINHHSERANGLSVILRNPCKLMIVATKDKEKIFVPPVLTSALEINKNAIKLKKRIGQGFFGYVYEGLWRSIPVAVKVLKKGSMEEDSFKREAQILKDLNHCNLIVLYGVSMKTEPFYIITELMKNGSLLTFLQGPKGKNLKPDKLVDAAGQVACGMEYLERKNCIHRDLAARNVLVGDDNNFLVKVADFGMARWMNDSLYVAKDHDVLFPIKWTAPEAANDRQFSIKSDVWSFGVLLMEIMTHGKVPYPGMSNSETLRRINEGYRMPCPSECPQPVYDIMKGCWNDDPVRRPSFRILHSKLKVVLISPGPNSRHHGFHSRKILPLDAIPKQQFRILPEERWLDNKW